MKRMKKIFAVLLTLAMVLGMSITTFAGTSTSATIKVNSIEKGDLVSYVQIVRPTEAGGWEYIKPTEEYDFGIDIADLNLDNPDNYAEAGTINPNLTGLNLSGLTFPTPVEATGTTFDIPVSQAGLYVVKIADPDNLREYSMLVAFVGYDYTDPDAPVLKDPEVTAKYTEMTLDKEIVNIDGDTNDTNGDQSVAPGDDVEYKVTAYYPTFTTAVESFTIVDKVTNGTIKEGTIKIDGADSKYGLSAKIDSDKKGFTITLDPAAYDTTMAGKSFTITYTVTADDPMDGNLENKVTSTIGKLASEIEIIVPTLEATIIKTDVDGVTPLTGATFTLYVVDENGTVDLKIGEGENDIVKATVVGTENQEVGEDGTLTFKGLDAGKKYYVKETKAPEGYAVQEYPYELTGAEIELLPENEKVKGDSYTLEDGTVVIPYTTTYTVKSQYDDINGWGETEDGNIIFKDTKLSSLPSTGGIGTTIFTIGGCAIIVIAAGLFFASRRKSAK